MQQAGAARQLSLRGMVLQQRKGPEVLCMVRRVSLPGIWTLRHMMLRLGPGLSCITAPPRLCIVLPNRTNENIAAPRAEAQAGDLALRVCQRRVQGEGARQLGALLLPKLLVRVCAPLRQAALLHPAPYICTHRPDALFLSGEPFTVLHLHGCMHV